MSIKFVHWIFQVTFLLVCERIFVLSINLSIGQENIKRATT